MSRLFFVSIAALLLAGCANRTFTDLGGGVGVPSESIDRYAETHGLSHEEARAAMREQLGQPGDTAYAEDYGVSIEPAHAPVEGAPY